MPTRTHRPPLPAATSPRLRVAAARLLGLAALGFSALHAEIPLPPATVYGVALRGSRPVTSGEIVARVSRGGRGALEASGEFVDVGGAVFYVVRIPMESDAGAPSAAGAPRAARNGDVLEQLVLGGVAGPPRSLTLLAGMVARHDEEFDGGPPAALFVRGDADSSGSVNITDGIHVLNGLFVGERIACRVASDVDDSGRLDLTDAIRVFQWLFLDGDAPAAPTPGSANYSPGDCGPDPTVDALDCESVSGKCI